MCISESKLSNVFFKKQKYSPLLNLHYVVTKIRLLKLRRICVTKVKIGKNKTTSLALIRLIYRRQVR